MSLPLLRSVLATLVGVFSHVEVYRPPPGHALIFLASDSPLQPVLAPTLGEELTAFGLWRGEDVAARWVLDSAGSRRVADGAPPVTDDHNILASRSPRVLGRGLARSRGEGVLADHDPLLAEHPELDRLALVERLWIPERIARIASVESDPTRRQLALTWLPAAEARRSRPLLLASALETEPADEHLRSLALVEAKASIARGGPVPSALRELTAAEGWIVEGWRAVAAGEWAAVERLEGSLAGVEPASPLFWQSLWLRGQWRVASIEAARHRQALAIFDSMLSHRADPAVLLLYAIAADRAGLTEGTLAALSDLSRVPRNERSPAIDRAARGLLRHRAYPPDQASWARTIDQRLSP